MSSYCDLTALIAQSNLLDVLYLQQRFPRAKLFAQAAVLQQQVERWQGETANELERTTRANPGNKRLAMLEQRAEHLELARQAATEARRALYDCP
jgi:hypothetical protein